MESYDRDIARYEAFMGAVKTHGLDYLKRAWDFEVCPIGFVAFVGLIVLLKLLGGQ